MLVFSVSVYIFLISLYKVSSESRESRHLENKRRRPSLKPSTSPPPKLPNMPSFKPSTRPTKSPATSFTLVPTSISGPVVTTSAVCPYAYSYAILPPLGFLASK